MSNGGTGTASQSQVSVSLRTLRSQACSQTDRGARGNSAPATFLASVGIAGACGTSNELLAFSAGASGFSRIPMADAPRPSTSQDSRGPESRLPTPQYPRRPDKSSRGPLALDLVLPQYKVKVPPRSSEIENSHLGAHLALKLPTLKGNSESPA
ncbi:hypothetical protein BV20DRAFT_961676 [Pilatotrama ljubarskyi]|nr:hypothetical protein BV20DRAFT_961676 [Pilatotrama ljubarskyi]